MSKGNVYANSRSVVHKGDSLTNVSAVPDVCKTPTPGGPIPIPYINVAFDRNLTKGTKKVRIAGNSIAISKSKLSTSTGDEPGTLGGIVSGKFKGKMAWGTSSMNVKAEGKGVVRFMDITMHNGNTYNTAWTQMGNPAVVTATAYGDDTPCDVCGKDPLTHRTHETVSAAADCSKLLKKLEEQAEAVDKRISDLSIEAAAIGKKMDELSEAHDQAIQTAHDNLKGFVGKDIAAFFKSASKEDKAEYLRINKIKTDLQKNNPNQAELDKMKKDQKAKMAEAKELNENGKRVYKDFPNGFMVGVLVCKCEEKPKKWASMSGAFVTPGFKEVAEKEGFIVVGPEALGSNDATYSEATSPRLQMAQSQEEKDQIRKDMSAKYKDMAKDPAPASPTRGNCAAPKLIQACLKAGHAVGTVSEKWFAPFQSDKYKVEQSRLEHQPNGSLKSEDRTFSHGDTVPSCDTCKRELPPMLCDSDKHKCK
ncbi:DUF4150 domain-containing protein [Acanthopleuribacter pedis]|uniref:DUF4150 domain-containing protein n=1 Tax=Acanthopleuribacter pedis TaxID=442870 RepID=A0A8J7QG80_9BACT|nr:DUF4150 domain-containing protein [Acanthopleuribacter pedis]MBO1317950.1 DUF4150 domain-containing protein [Acanthopleuribacter pedis]